MRKNITAAVVAMLVTALITTAALFLNGCTASKNSGDMSSPKPERVAVLFSSLAEMWTDAGGTVSITVGESVERGFAPEGTPLVDSGAGKNINMELLLTLEPDLVICSADIPAQAEVSEFLNENGIKAIAFHVETFDDYTNVMRQMTCITGNAEAYEKYVTDQRNQIDSLLSSNNLISSDGKTFLFVRAGSSAASTKAKLAEDHFACAMLEEFGCENIADAAPILLDGLSMEAVISADPDYIFFSLMGDADAAVANVHSLLESDVWQSLSAVKEGSTVILPKELFHFKPCGRWSEAYSYLADIIKEELP